jgi:3',5'-cyclic AMP phosphodiesterase CpdA
VLVLGDLAYPNGTAREFQECYDPTWGRFKDRTRPTPGNHDYQTPGAVPYYAYWGERAGAAGEGFYSFELGAWHIIALNSNIRDGPLKSKQEQWLAEDLKRHPTLCALAFFHHPRFSSGGHGSDPRQDPLFRILHSYGVDVVLGGHDHDYERFAPLDPEGRQDKRRGIRQFVAGTGGAALTPFIWIQPYSEVRINDAHGILRMTLRSESYGWEFLSAPGERLLDTGRSECH